MNAVQPANLSASVRQRLLNLSHARGEDFNYVLVRYAIERFLFRLGQSHYADQFVLKGALLFLIWDTPGHRATRDLDLLGFGDSSSETLQHIFREVCLTPVEPDGIIFDPESIRIRTIREEQEYGGKRITLTASLEKALIPVRIDIGFGDAVVPTSTLAYYPALLNYPSPRISIYPKETVVAEKAHAMVILDMSNSRMKDFFDLWMLARLFSFDGELLVRAIRTTFERRKTSFPVDKPVALTSEFFDNSNKRAQWRAFIKRNLLNIGNIELSEVMQDIDDFLAPPFHAIAHALSFAARWEPNNFWFPSE